MKINLINKIIPGLLLTGIVVSVGCFGPFKKSKSSSGGGGGSSTPASTTAEKEVASDPGKASTTTTSAEESVPPLPGSKAGYGCLQGVVIDGYTGQPIALADPAKMFVLIRGTKIAAAKVDDSNLVGQYYICEIPLDEDYSVFGFLDGYQNFEGTVNIASTVGNRTGAANAIVTDIVKKDPVVIKNIVLFPTAAGGRDFTVRVYNQGAVVEGALVDLEPLPGAGNHFSVDGSALNYTNGTRNFSQRVSSDVSGNAVFTADKISLGTSYNVRVTPPTALNVSVPAAQTISLGISGAGVDDSNTYVLNFEVTNTNQPLTIIACSTQAEAYNSSGRIIVVFNRDIELNRNDNAWVATYAPAGSPTDLAAEVADFDAESMTATISGGNMLILGPTWATQPKTPDYEKDDLDILNDDLNGVVTYPAGILSVKPSNESKIAWQTLTALNGGGLCTFNTRLFKSRN